MIEKKIHYCWFGGKKKPKLVKKCINSWKKYCPNCEIIEWNETNFDLNYNIYVKEAYENKKWAFVSDVVRLYALYNYGGIYMDTDVEVIKPLDEFFDNNGFTGFESKNNMITGIMGCKKNNKLFKELLDYYDNRHFIKEDGTFDLSTNTVIITNILLKKGYKRNNKYQKKNNLTLYPTDYFCPIDFETKKMNKTKNTATIHWFNGSWIPKKQKMKMKIYYIVSKILGKENAKKISKIMKERK